MEFLAFARENGWKTAVVSGAFSEVIADFCFNLGFDWVRANGFSHDGHYLDGLLRGPIIDARAKAE
ncbi:haloacid dehalogenase-like hydrolase, partial [Pectobacterium brasiliense]|uniref:haloacid dehalogenase-like hydrolase n=1 Tax=Pectobacterium brasiliense TaxID=180957 RepID=UPI001F07FF96